MNEINKLLESIKFDSHSINHSINQLEEKLRANPIGLPACFIPFKKGHSIFRCRKHENKINFFCEKSKISYRQDIEKIVEFGRCNDIGQSVFYGSINIENTKENNGVKTKEIIDGSLTSILETSTLFRDNLDGHERYTVGEWVLKKDFEPFAMPPQKNKTISETNKLFLKQYDDLYKGEKKITPEHIKFIDLCGREFSKKVLSGNHTEYAASALISYYLLEMFPGIVYPSIQTESKGVNVAIKSDIFDEYFDLQYVNVFDFYKFSNDFLLIPKFECKPIDGKSFSYYTDSNPLFSHDKDIIEYFKTKGVPEDSIKNTFPNLPHQLL